MNIEIKETPLNRYRRIFWKIGFVWLAVFGVVLLMFLFVLFITAEAMTFDKSIMLVIGTSTSMFSLYIFKSNKVVRIKLITDRSITLIDGKKKLEIRKEDILYVSISGLYYFTKNYGIDIKVKSRGFFSVRRYFCFNDPQNDLIAIFKKMNIKVKGLI